MQTALGWRLPAAERPKRAFYGLYEVYSLAGSLKHVPAAACLPLGGPSAQVVMGRSADSIYMVMEFVEHDLKGLAESMRQPFTTAEVRENSAGGPALCAPRGAGLLGLPGQ